MLSTRRSRSNVRPEHNGVFFYVLSLKVESIDVCFFFLRLVLQQSVSYFGSILSYVIIAIPIFFGLYDGMPASDLSAIISKVLSSWSISVRMLYTTKLVNERIS